jgi:hypothetical protein
LLTSGVSHLPSVAVSVPGLVPQDSRDSVLARGIRAMDSMVRCWRTDPASSSAAMVAAWLIDVLAGVEGVRLSCAGTESVVLGVDPSQCVEKIREVLDRALAEPRFTGWQLLE